MKEIPILFNAEMVRAILDGRKTQTRRLINEQPIFPDPIFVTLDRGEFIEMNENGSTGNFFLSPFGKPMDILCVCEELEDIDGFGCWYYKADGSSLFHDHGISLDIISNKDKRGFPLDVKAKHMPREACRLRLRVKRVWVERVQGIDEEGASLEGVDGVLVPPDGGSMPCYEGFRSYGILSMETGAKTLLLGAASSR